MAKTWFLVTGFTELDILPTPDIRFNVRGRHFYKPTWVLGFPFLEHLLILATERDSTRFETEHCNNLTFNTKYMNVNDPDFLQNYILK